MRLVILLWLIFICERNNGLIEYRGLILTDGLALAAERRSIPSLGNSCTPPIIYAFICCTLVTHVVDGNILRQSKPARTFSPWAYRLLRMALVPFLWLICRPKIIGKENMPSSGPCFIIASHSNPYDGFIINVLVHEPIASVMTEEYFRGGIIAFMLSKVGLVPTRKFEPQLTPVRRLLRLVKDNRIILIMPEGERNWDGVTRPTVTSTGKLFRRLGVPVHPVILHNGYLSWPGWARWPRLIKIYVEFRRPLYFTPDWTDDHAAEMVDAAIQWSPDRDLAEYAIRIPRGFRPAAGIKNLIFLCPQCRKEEGLKEVRGRYLTCKLCDSRWRVGGDSYLTNEITGERRSSTETFRYICKFDRKSRDFGPQGMGLARLADISVFEEVEFPSREFLGRFDAIMREDSISLIPREEGETINIPFNVVQSISIEKHSQLQVRLTEVLYQLHLDRRGSAIQWAVYLQALMPHLDRHLIRPMGEHYLTQLGNSAPQ